MNKIEIPASEFRKMFLQDGGEAITAQKKEKYQDLTGQYIHPLPKQMEELSNAEIEGGEHVATQGKVLKAEGDKHSQGGMAVSLSEGDRVLSDNLQIGKELAKQLSEQFNIKVNPTDTYAKVLDKHLKKIGHTEAVEEVENSIKKLDEQKIKVKDESTLALNSEYLMNEIHEENTKVEELEPLKNEMFELLYNQQEASKETEESTNKMQNGGSIQDLMQKYNISPERVKEMFQDGGTPKIDKFGRPIPSLNKFQPGITLGQMQGQNRKYTPEEKATIKKYYSTVVKDADTLKALNERIDNNTLVYNENLLKEVATNKDIPLQKQSETEKNLFGVQTDSRLKDYLYSSDFQNKFGRPFGSQPNDEALIYNDIIKGLEDEGVKYNGSPTTGQGTELFGNVNAGQPKFVKQLEGAQDYSLDVTKFKQSTPEQQQQVADALGVPLEYIKGESDKITTGFIDFKPKAPVEAPTSPTTPIQPTATPVAQTEEEKRRMGLLLMPERMYQNPSFLAPMKFSPTIYTGERSEVSPEQQLMEINRQQLATKEQLAQLPDAQRAATLSSMDSNLATASSKAVSDAERYNAQARERESYENAEVKTRQSLSDAQSAAQYQQLMGRELAGFDANMQAQNNMRFQDNFGKWSAVNAYNRANSLNPDIQFNGSTYEVRNPSEYIENLIEQKKPIAKKGGRFNKKRFGK
jgi:hypothetical protein